LGACLQKLGVRKVYFITTVIERTEYRKLRWRKKSDEKYKLKELTIPLGLRGEEKETWERERASYKRV